jgi:hypothetical protein
MRFETIRKLILIKEIKKKLIIYCYLKIIFINEERRKSNTPH